MKFNKKTAFLFSLLLLAPGAAIAAEPTAAQVQAWAEKAIAVRAQTQKAVDAFAQREAKLLDEVERLDGEIVRIRRQRQKTEAYVADQRQKTVDIKRQLDEIDRIRVGLEPLLDDSLLRLHEEDAKALPFGVAEREQRLAYLEKSLNDYEMSLAQKTKLLLASLAAEARRGLVVTVAEEEIKVEDLIIRARLIRLGELALFAVDAGKERAWRWDPAQGVFAGQPGWARELSDLADMAQQKRLIALVEVPLGRTPVREGGE